MAMLLATDVQISREGRRRLPTILGMNAMRTMGHRLLLAAWGLLGLAGVCVAQTPEIARPAKSYRMAYPGELTADAIPQPTSIDGSIIKVRGQSPAGEGSAASSSSPGVPPAGAASASAAASCSAGCATGDCSHRGSHFLRHLKARLCSPEYAVANPTGCGTHFSEKNFFFGSCCQFFTPGRECGSCGLGGCGLGRLRNCPPIIYGPGSANPFNPCVYDSFLNH